MPDRTEYATGVPSWVGPPDLRTSGPPDLRTSRPSDQDAAVFGVIKSAPMSEVSRCRKSKRVRPPVGYDGRP